MAPPTRTIVETTYLFLLAVAVAVPIVGVLRWFAAAVPLPYGLDYNEGIVWKQMVEIVAGRGYAPIDRFPAIVFHYPPVFHLVTAALAATGVDPLVAGRLVSLTATAGSALLIGDLARRLTPPPSRFAGVALAAGTTMFVLFEAVHTWAPQMRVDALAGFFAFAGLWCVTRSDHRPALIYLAAVCFVASAFTKQVSVVTAAAGLGALLLLRPRRGVAALVTTVVLGLAILAALTWQTDGGVLRHLFLYNINRFETDRIIVNLRLGTRPVDKLILVLGAAGYVAVAVRTWRERRRRSDLGLTTAAMLLLVPIATLSLVTTGKSGASTSYYIQWEGALAVFAAFALAWLVTAGSDALAQNQPVRAAGWAAIPLALALRAAVQSDTSHLRQIAQLRHDQPIIARLLEPVRGDIISDDMVILMRLHRDVVWEPAIFAELAQMGRWDEGLVVKAFNRHCIGAVVSDGDAGGKWFDERYNPAVQAAMNTALPRRIRIGPRVVHLPAAAAADETPIVAAAQRC